MRRTLVIAAGAVVLLVVMSYVTGSTAARRSATAVHTAAVTAATVVCPAVDAVPSGSSARAVFADVGAALQPANKGGGTVTLSTLAGVKTRNSALHPRPASTLTVKTGTPNAMSAAATGPIAAALTGDELIETPSAGRFRGLLGTSCLSPATNWWFAGADGRVGYTDALVLANPAPTPAEVAVTLWTAKGPDAPPHLDAIPVPARSRVTISIASVAPDVATIAMHVHADSGAVVAAVIDRRSSALNSNGGDFIPPTQGPSRKAMVTGFPGGPGTRKLVLADPGAVDATVSLKLVSKSGTFAPAGANQVVVHQQHTKVVDLTKVFGGLPGSVKVTSDQPVIAQGLSVATATGLRPDLMWLAAVPPLSGPAGVADGTEPDGGQTLLVLTAPDATAQVRVATPSGRHSVLTVPGGHSVGVVITTLINSGAGPWPFTVTPLGSAPVYAARVLVFSGAHGALITGEPLRSLPHPIPLPPVRDDPRVAVR